MPQDTPPATRRIPGRTRPGRLRLLDRYLALREQLLLTRRDGPWATAACADIGLGEQAHTTAEWAAWLRDRWPGIEVLGIDSEHWRVDNARREHSGPGLRYACASFAPSPPEPLRLVRALNLLRGYPDHELPTAWGAMARDLLPGGLLVEGSTDQPGAALGAHLLRRTDRGLEHEALLFATDLTRGFAPAMFRGVLPHRMRARGDHGATARAFLDRWTTAWEPTRSSADPAAMFRRSVRALADAGEPVEADEPLLEQGLMLWRAPTLAGHFSLDLAAGSP